MSDLGRLSVILKEWIWTWIELEFIYSCLEDIQDYSKQYEIDKKDMK